MHGVIHSGLPYFNAVPRVSSDVIEQTTNGFCVQLRAWCRSGRAAVYPVFASAARQDYINKNNELVCLSRRLT